ncbi:MAG: S-layer y domain [Acidimicrobiaceae bacterium]|jgi:hypothetical protein
MSRVTLVDQTHRRTAPPARPWTSTTCLIRCARDDTAQILFNASKVITEETLAAGLDAFTDDNGNDNEAAINALAKAGVVKGKGGGLYDPSGAVSRAQVALFFVRFIQLIVDAGQLQPL